MQAKIEKRKKDQQYHSAALKFWNRETGAKQRKGSLTKGYSRSKSDAYSKALWTLGKGRLANEAIYKQKAQVSRFADKTGESRSRNYNVKKYKEILAKQRQIESTINNTFGRNMDIAHQAIMRNHQGQIAKNRASIGARPEYGAPVFMPPRDRAGQNMANIQMALSIASLASGFK